MAHDARRWLALLAAGAAVTAVPPAGAQAAEPVVSVGSAVVMETLSRGDWVPALVPVTLDRPAAGPVTVTYATADGTALAALPARDYQPASGTLTIPAGATGGTIEVFVLGDREPEGEEDLTVTLADPSGATLGTSDGAVVIRDRVGAGLVVSDTRVVETDDPAATKVVATFALAAPSTADVTVQWTTAAFPPRPGGAALPGAEFLERSGTAVIPAGSLYTRVPLWIRGDDVPEGPEQFVLVVSDASTPVRDSDGRVTIADEDPPSPLLTTTVPAFAQPADHPLESPEQPSLSADGRMVAFAVRHDNAPLGELRVADRLTGLTRHIAYQLTDAAPTISADGRVVAFWTTSRLAPEDPDLSADVYVQDLTTGVTTLVSGRPFGPGDALARLTRPVLSADGRFVAYELHEPSPTGPVGHVVLWDAATGTHERVDVAADGTLGNGHADWPSISADGRFVAFTSYATNLVPGDTNGLPDVFVHDTVSGTTTRVSIAGDGTQGDSPSGGGDQVNGNAIAISPDGTRVAFASLAGNLVPGDTDEDVDVFVRDVAAGTTTLASVPPQGRPLSGATTVSLAGNGVVTFAADDLRERTQHVYRHDLATGTTVLVSRASDGTIADSTASTPALSADGRVIAFGSAAGNLVSGDTNGRPDIFVRGPFS
ncbi:MAG TPA: Calx-beta domain-containing protein [Acidimicrobiales bacterium]